MTTSSWRKNEETMGPSRRYYQFWQGFYSEEFEEFDGFFTMLLEPMGLEERYGRPVSIVSVFPPFPYPFPRTDRNKEILLAWSGEERYDPEVDRYDASLVMRATNLEKRVICLPLFIVGSYMANLWPLYAVPRPLAPKQHFCLFVVSNPRCHVRNRFFQKLSAQYKAVHSCGPSFNNTGVLAPRPREEYFRFISQFRFMICFENSNAHPEYMTEKLHNAWAGGAIPIYWGASRAREWLNPGAFLYLEDDSDAGMDELIARIAVLDRDEAAYQEMHARPLLRDGKIPEELSLDHIRSQIDVAISNTVT